MLILIALEPRLYSEAIADAIQDRRPHLEVQIVEPDALGSEVARLIPRLVLCNEPRPAGSDAGLAWIEYHPYNSTKATIHVGDQRFEQDVVSLADLLSVIDRAENLV